MEALSAFHAGAVSRISAARVPSLSRSHWQRVSFKQSILGASQLHLTLSQRRRQSRGASTSFSGSHMYSPAVPRGSAVADAVEVTETIEPNSRVKLNVKVAPKACKESYDWVLKEFSKRTKIPGFQRGKNVPEAILVNFVGKDKIKAAAIEAVLKRTLPQALSSVAGRALKDSEHIISSIDDLKSAFSPTSLLSYDVVVDVIPEVKWTTPEAYKNLKVVVEIEDESSYSRAAEAEFRSRHKNLGSLRIVEDRSVEIGDVVILDVSCNRVNEDGTEGERILSAEQKGFQLDTEDGLNYLPGFVDQIVDMKRGDTRTFELIFPQTWHVEVTRGARGRFVVECKEHFYRVLPVLEDTLAGRFVDGCDTLEQAREVLLKKHKDNYELEKLRATKNLLMKELAKVAHVDVPHSLIEEQGRNLYAGKLLELQARMNMSKEQLAGLANEQMVTNYLISQKESIIEGVKQILAVSEMFKRERLEYSEEELKKDVESAEGDLKQFTQEYDKERIVELAKEFLEEAKVLDWLMAHADITYTTIKSQ